MKANSEKNMVDDQIERINRNATKEGNNLIMDWIEDLNESIEAEENIFK